MRALKTSSHIRSVLKGMSWRIIATVDTVFIVYLITYFVLGKPSIESAIKIGVAEFLIKLAIYYIHERIWLNILKKQATTNKEIISKSISWRFVATITTFIISGIILESFDELALFIAISELVTKFALYYLHEKLWLKLPLGKIRRYFSRQ
ncbi:DUF2061 domain-containing protein [uncultured Algibacter sp.]|uniref:DUF2061 domain-containing protein n=1 Tax=uncultured Algibacter sp. TaxID=298659 RepID=UPI002627E5FC|nr:DUF2061 domain-containing protein [uncultured Algibacter sp.]